MTRGQAAPSASLAPCYLQVGRRRGFLLEARSTRGEAPLLSECLVPALASPQKHPWQKAASS